MNLNSVCLCVSSDADGVLSEVQWAQGGADGVLSEVQWVQGGGQGCVQVRAAEPQAVHRAAHRVYAQLEELHTKQIMKSQSVSNISED